MGTARWSYGLARKRFAGNYEAEQRHRSRRTFRDVAPGLNGRSGTYLCQRAQYGTAVLAVIVSCASVLHSLRAVLASGCRLHGAHLYVLGGDGESLHLIEFDREADAP